MDQLQATPRRFPMVGGLADFLAAGTSPQRTQQMRGLMEFLQVPDIAKTLDRVSYGEPLTTGAGMTTKLRPEAENTLMAALGMTPVGKPAQAGAMALGRAGERYAERVVPQVMSRGGLPAEMLSAMAQGTQSPATVFHGTPHLFNKFDASKIGTGEGNQTYGYGLYLAENPEVARMYRDVLTQSDAMVDGQILDSTNPKHLLARVLNEESGNVVAARDSLKMFARPGGSKSVSDAAKAALELLDAGERPVMQTVKPQGSLMQVDLPDEQIAKMLDFDKPLNKQSKPVRDALSKLGITVDDTKLGEYEDALLGALMTDAPTGPLPRQPMNMTGGEIIKELQRNPSRYLPQIMQGRELTQAMINPAQGASSVLRQAGIPGIRYLDEGSRSKFRIQNTVKGKPYGEPVSFMTERQAQEYAKEQAAKGFGTQTLPGTSNFVVFPGMEDMLRIEQINNQPVESLFRSLGR